MFQGLSDGPLLWAPLILVGSVLWALIWYMVYSWYVLGSRLGAHRKALGVLLKCGMVLYGIVSYGMV